MHITLQPKQIIYRSNIGLGNLRKIKCWYFSLLTFWPVLACGRSQNTKLCLKNIFSYLVQSCSLTLCLSINFWLFHVLNLIFNTNIYFLKILEGLVAKKIFFALLKGNEVNLLSDKVTAPLDHSRFPVDVILKMFLNFVDVGLYR